MDLKQQKRQLRITEILDSLEIYWRKNPELRLAQIVSNAWHIHPSYKRDPEPDIQDVFYFTDNNFLQSLELLDSRPNESTIQRPSEE
jgi:uncharacterized protein YihD (DUF1040 family)